MKDLIEAIAQIHFALDNPNKQARHLAHQLAWKAGIGQINLDDFQGRQESYRLTEGAAIVALRQVAAQALAVLDAKK